MSPDAISSVENEVTAREVYEYYPVVAEFIDYLRWLAEQNFGFKISVGDLWQLYHDGVRECRSWDEVLHDIGLPERD